MSAAGEAAKGDAGEAPLRTLRLFAAIDPPSGVRRALEDLRADLPGARWTRPDQMHVTLRFIGSVEAAAAAGTIASALSAVAVPAFALSAAGFGVFPSLRSPRILWAALSPGDPLRGLAADVEEALATTGVVPREEKPFSPHLTLARLDGARPAAVRSWMERREGFAAGPWEVSEFFLYSSRLTPAGAVHTKVESYPLARASAPVPEAR